MGKVIRMTRDEMVHELVEQAVEWLLSSDPDGNTFLTDIKAARSCLTHAIELCEKSNG